MRIRKYGKKKLGLFIGIKVLAITYMFLLMTSYSTNFTNAFMNDKANSPVQFKAEWQEKVPKDNSSLKFVGQGGSCGEIYAFVQNGNKGDMNEDLKYEIYFNSKGGPKQGKMIHSQQVHGLKKGEKVQLTYSELSESGKYMFKAYQSSGHSGKGELWSKEILISDCDTKTNVPNEQEKDINSEEIQNAPVSNTNEATPSNEVKPSKNTNEATPSKKTNEATPPKETKAKANSEEKKAEEIQKVEIEANNSEATETKAINKKVTKTEDVNVKDSKANEVDEIESDSDVEIQKQ